MKKFTIPNQKMTELTAKFMIISINSDNYIRRGYDKGGANGMDAKDVQKKLNNDSITPEQKKTRVFYY